MKVLLVTDAWKPQVNGVVTTLENLVKELSIKNEVKIIEPSSFVSVPVPFYREIKLSLNVFKIKKIIKDFRPEIIHIATEGPLGFYARQLCLAKKLNFSTSYHTNFPLYLLPEKTQAPSDREKPNRDPHPEFLCRHRGNTSSPTS